MVFANLRRDERIGLGIAVLLHVGLVAVLLVRPGPKPVFEPPQKMTVNLATDVGLTETAPQPVNESRAAVAPELAPEPAPAPEPASEPAPAPKPQPMVQPAIAPPKPVATTPPRPKPVPRAAPAPKPKPAPRVAPAPPKAAPAPAKAKPAPAASSNAPRRRPDAPSGHAQTATVPSKKAGASRIGSDFLAGAGSSTKTDETRIPASQIGASAKASLVQAIARQLKPKWQPPDGPDVDKITTYLRFRLNADGSLAGRPEMVRQTGVTPVNEAQAKRHAEQAIRAVQLAAPFKLPDEYYNAWKVVGPFGFDWKLSQ
jgi:hypothetical protein